MAVQLYSLYIYIHPKIIYWYTHKGNEDDSVYTRPTAEQHALSSCQPPTHSRRNGKIDNAYAATSPESDIFDTIRKCDGRKDSMSSDPEFDRR